MKCGFCNKEIDIKQEWLKKPLYQKLKDALNGWYNFDFTLLQTESFLKDLARNLGPVFYFIIAIFLVFFGFAYLFIPVFNFIDKYVFLKPLFGSRADFNLFAAIISMIIGAILLVVFLFLNYFMFKRDIENNFKVIFNKNLTSLKCPYCGKENKLKINYLK